MQLELQMFVLTIRFLLLTQHPLLQFLRLVLLPILLLLSPFHHPQSLFLHTNNTHYLFLDLIWVNQDQKDHEGFFTADDGRVGRLDSIFSPWVVTPCPQRHHCNSTLDYSNVWTCWPNSGSGLYCHPTGYRHYGLDVLPANYSKFDEGLIIRYSGADGLNTHIHIVCEKSSNENSISEFEQEVIYRDQHFRYFVKSEIGCPKTLYRPSFPLPPADPTPTPDPNSFIPSHRFKTAKDNEGHNIEFNLKLIDTIKPIQLFLGMDSYLSNNSLHIHPRKAISCPENSSCPGISGKSNVWRCFENASFLQECYPIGDERYSLSINLSDMTDPFFGVDISYGGGYSKFHFLLHIHCDSQIEHITYSEVGRIIDNMTEITVYLDAFSSHVCLMEHYYSITFGGIFLFILFTFSIFYFFLGVIFSLKKAGEPTLPNSEFWNGLLTNVVTGFLFIFSCGKNSSGLANYNSI